MTKRSYIVKLSVISFQLYSAESLPKGTNQMTNAERQHIEQKLVQILVLDTVILFPLLKEKMKKKTKKSLTKTF